jgi:hypothetical protein
MPTIANMGGFGTGGSADMGGFGGGGVVVAPSSPVQVPMGVLQLPALPQGHFPLLAGTKFPRRAWDPNLYAQTVLAEFGASGWMETITIDPPPSDIGAIGEDVAELLRKAELRNARAPEILAQANDASAYWADMLMATSASRPATWDLITACATVGQLVAMHFKLMFSRPRPVQIYPALMPPILTPAHPSYPNAHALQSWIITKALVTVVPALTVQLELLAQRIAENREVAGLHYPSDTRASFALAPQVVDLLAKGRLFSEIIRLAKAEWDGVSEVPFPTA